MKIVFSTKNVSRASFLDTCRFAFDYGFEVFEIYDAVKERTAVIVLEAHQRARQVLDQAETQSRQIREQTLSWLNRVRSSYERLRTDISATITRTAGELDRAGKALAESNGEFRSHDAAMQEVANSLKKAEQTARGGRDAAL